MAKNEIKTETVAEQYMAEVIGPRIEAIEESIGSLRTNQGAVLKAVKDSNAVLEAKFEEMRAAKAQGRQFVYCNKENVDASINENLKNVLDKNLCRLRAAAAALIAFALLSVGYVHYCKHLAPQSWANRNYEAALELDENNPGRAYHDIMQDFKSGYKAEARQKVYEREIAGKERTEKKRRYEEMLNRYLAGVDPLCVTVTNFIEKEDSDGKTESLVFLRDGVDEYVAYILPDGTICITLDTSINSIEKAKASIQFPEIRRRHAFVSPEELVEIGRVFEVEGR